MIKINAITICVNYAKKLDYIAARSHKWFSKWYIVTEETDIETQEVCKKYDNMVVLYYKFKTNIATFNKGGGLRLAQQEVYKNHPKEYTLILDADIVLPSNFEELINSANCEEGILYGPVERRDYVCLSDLESNKNGQYYANSRNFVGFFVLYNANDKYYNNGYNCSGVDIDFRNKFGDNVKYIDGLSVKHVGKERVNWNGVCGVSDFDWGM
jgi:hypothetical protein